MTRFRHGRAVADRLLAQLCALVRERGSYLTAGRLRIALAAATQRVAGYYTLSASSVLLVDVPSAFGKKLPRYPDVPVARLGRLAVDQSYRCRSLGAALLWDAMNRSARSEVAVHALLVDANDDEPSAFYAHHGFVALDAERRRMMLPVAAIRRV